MRFLRGGFAALVCAACVALCACGGDRAKNDNYEEAALNLPAGAELKPDDIVPEALGLYLDVDTRPNFEAYYKPFNVKGIYVTASIAGIPGYFETRFDLARETEINAMVIDIKNDEGDITVVGKIPLADELGVSYKYIDDFDALIEPLKEAGIYLIARVVVFKDTSITEIRPDYAIQLDKPDYKGVYKAWMGSKGNTGPAWLNPYNRDVWDYYAKLSAEIAELGFDEIQYDYIRFPTDRNEQYADYGDTGGLSKIEIITEFSRYIKDSMSSYPIKLSADIFATVIDSDLDASLIGQDIIELSKIFDIVSPMAYPSHYNPGSMGLRYPDLEPYETLYRSMTHLLERQAAEIPEGENAALVRPWIQDFSFSGEGHMTYDAKAVRDEINGCYDAGVTGWMLWNAANKYTRDALETIRANED